MRARATAALAAMGVAVLSGCQFSGLAGTTLPGGHGGTLAKVHDYTIYFDDVLDLVKQSGVHENDVNVGEVKSIDLVDGKAKVVIRVEKDVPVPANTIAVVRQTALLGEKYVSLEVPPGSLPSPTVIPYGDGKDIKIPAGANEEFQAEDVFGALSALLNGGGVEQLQTISVELQQALTGRESNIKDLLAQLDDLTGSLNTHRTEIVRALDSLDKLAQTLVVQRQTIATALQDIAPGLKVLADERVQLVSLLKGLDNLSVTAKRVLKETTANTVDDLRLLEPTLNRLTQNGTEIASSLQLLLSYPFGDAVFNAVPGDFTGLRVTLNLDLRPNSPNNPLSPNGPLCGSLPVDLPITVPKPPFCNSTAAADTAASTPKTVTLGVNGAQPDSAAVAGPNTTLPTTGTTGSTGTTPLQQTLLGLDQVFTGVFQ